MKGVFDRSGETAAAIVVLGYAPGLSVELLRQVLDLSHPGTVRLINRLEEEGLVERRKAADGRAVALHLTRKGGALRKKLIDRRLDTLEMAKHRICRLCAVRLCSDCPIPGNAI